MKLLNDYRVRVDYSMVLMVLPLIIYYMLFKTHIYNLVAGGFIFIYFTGLLAFLNRYYKEVIGKVTAEKLGIGTTINLKSLKPLTLYKQDMDAKKIRKIEWTQVVIIVLSNTILLMVSYSLDKDGYLTKVLLGSWLLSLLIFWKNFMYIIKSHQYKDCVFRYTDKSVKIYQKGHVEIVKQDANALKKLWAYNETKTYHYFVKGIESGNVEFWSVVHNDQIIGELYIFWRSEDLDEANGINRAYLCAYRIQETYQGRGYGKKLMTSVFERIEEKGFTEITIGIDNDDYKRLKSMYSYYGFETLLKHTNCDHHYLDDNGKPVISDEPFAIYLKNL